MATWEAKWAGYTGLTLWAEGDTEAQARNKALAEVKRNGKDWREGNLTVYRTDGQAAPGRARVSPNLSPKA